MESTVSILKTLFIAYVILAALMFIFQYKLIYYPSKTIINTPKDISLEYEDVTFLGSDGTKLFGWYIPKKGAKSTILFMHGNGGNISNRLDSIKLFNSLGLNLFIFDYRGYGKSEGSPSEQNSYDDAKSAWDYLIDQKGSNANQIIIWGRSLGGSIAAHLAAHTKPKGVIVESSFTSAVDIASKAYPYIPKILVRFKYDTKEYVKNINSPILIIHSVDDKMIPFKHADILYKYSNNPKTLLKIKGSHNDGFLESLPVYKKGLNKFLEDIRKG
ncbi:MAG: alpha/beta hydrolase [Campylobacterota bacterium]|nr:alpha/beta hydrolase [Campylobacterota bacterium]